MPPMSTLPFTMDDLDQAMLATHHQGIWEITPDLRALITREIKTATDESRLDFDSDSSRNRETFTVMAALYTLALEAGYRLAGGDPTPREGN